MDGGGERIVRLKNSGVELSKWEVANLLRDNLIYRMSKCASSRLQ